MMRIHPVILLAVFYFFQLHLNAQSAEIDKGDAAYEAFDFQEALFFFENANDANPGDPSVTRRIANTYRRMGQPTMAAEWYQKTLEIDASNAEDMLSYAEILKTLQQYDEAIQWYELYAKLRPSDMRAQSHLRDKQYYRDLFADTSRYEMKRFKLNSDDPVLGITLFEDEKFLVSGVELGKSKSETTTINPYLDVYLCDFSEANELVNPVRMDENVNSAYHDGPAYYCFADRTLYITRTSMKGKKPKYNKNGNAILKIFEAQYDGTNWSQARELKFNDEGFSNGHPCLSKDGQTMYFYSDRDGGMGGNDLYVCFKSGSGWSQPINLGPNVNTEGNEQFPFLGEDGLLYFASNGHAGLGGMDVFASEQIGEVWQRPENLGAPINSSMDDFSIVYDKETDNGFFCSSRNGRGDDDMFFYKHVSIKNMVIAGRIKANTPNVSLAGERIQITKVNTGEVIYQALDEFESFEFTANAGDIIEIVMMDAEYFDQDAPVITYEVASPILDPFVNLGEQAADLIKLPTREGKLSDHKTHGLVESKATLPVGDPNRMNELENLDTDANTTTDDLSQLNLNSQSNTLQDFNLKIQEAEKLYAEKKYQQAANAYKSAIQLQPENLEAHNGLANCDTQIALEKQMAENKTQNAFDKKIAEADKLFGEKKYKLALDAYTQACALNEGEAYPRDKVAQCAAMLNEEREKNYNDKLATADKLFEQGKWGEAKSAYMTAIQMHPEDVYPKNQMALIDDKMQLESAAKQRMKYDDKIEEADKLFSQRKYVESKAAYNAASAMLPTEAYPKQQIANIENLLNPKARQNTTEQTATTEKKPSEFDLAVPVVDLVALSIDNVIFDFNKAFIREEDKAILDKVYAQMAEKPDTRLLIRAHCDSRGSMAYNQSLSMSRAMAVQGYLMQKGIKRERLKAEWFGEQRPLNGCIDDVPCEEDQYEINRRAEFKLVALQN